MVHLYTDGSCLGNPGPGGWACVLVSIDDATGEARAEKHISGSEIQTTNNRMEICAVIRGLEAIKKPCRIIIHSDSKYVCNAFNQQWIHRWVENEARGNNKAANWDLWKQLWPLYLKYLPEFVWVKGHSGDKYNELCDKLAVTEAKGVKKNGTGHS